MEAEPREQVMAQCRAALAMSPAGFGLPDFTSLFTDMPTLYVSEIRELAKGSPFSAMEICVALSPGTELP